MVWCEMPIKERMRLSGCSGAVIAISQRLHRAPRILVSVTTAIVSLALLAGCGGATRERVIIRVAGAFPITESALHHTLVLLSVGEPLPESPKYSACIAHLQEIALFLKSRQQLQKECREQYAELKRSALHLLIADQWLIGSAADEGTPVSNEDITRRMQEKYGSAAGKQEYESILGVGSHTAADVRLEVQVELASRQVNGKLRAYSLELTPGQVASYYRHEITRFRLPESREVDVLGNVSEKARITAALREVKRGVSFSSLTYHELLKRLDFASLGEEKRIFYRAAFKARPGMIVGPLRINGYYFLFEVAHITPARVLSLHEAAPAIERTLAAERRVRFVTSWRRRWIARTSCLPAYVVPKCRQAHISEAKAAPEDPLELN
jgi:hypothetical protein